MSRNVSSWRVFRASAALELAHLRANRAFVALSALAAVSLLVMVSLFGLTGSYAPIAINIQDRGPFASRIVDAMKTAYHSFAIKYASLDEANQMLRSGRLVGIVTIPENFSADIEHDKTAYLDIQVDNVNVDLTNDVQRALPAVIVANGNRFPGVRVRMEEHDVLPHDTGYIPYLVVSALTSSYREVSCERTPIRALSAAPPLRTSSPRTRTEPEVGLFKPQMVSIRVVLPAPFGPTMPTTELGAMEKVKFRSAEILPKVHVRSFISIAMNLSRIANFWSQSMKSQRLLRKSTLLRQGDLECPEWSTTKAARLAFHAEINRAAIEER